LTGGDAKQYIADEFANARKRTRKNEKDILVVVRDADLDKHDDVISAFTVPGVVSAVIPRRNIETWLYFIDNQNSADSQDENADRKTEYPKSGTKPTLYGEKLESVLNDMRQNRIPPNIPDSLCKTAYQLIACEKQKQPL
jgi:hypothetical protein